MPFEIPIDPRLSFMGRRRRRAGGGGGDATPDSGRARYDFEGDATDSWNDNDLTVSGNPAYVAGQDGNAADLDGGDDYFTAPFSFDSSDDFSFVGWIYFDAIGDFNPIFGQRDGFATMDWSVYYEAGGSAGTADGFTIAIGESADSVQATGSTTSTGSWNHVGLTKGGSSWTFYFGGSSDTSFTDGTSWTENDSLHFGAWPGDPRFSDIRFDNLQWFDDELSASEVSNHQTTGTIDG